MPAPPTPAVIGGFSNKSAHSAKKMNISRKVLQTSIFGSTQRVDMLQMNNTELARKVTELKLEVNQQACELQTARAESFNLRVKLNRLQSQNNTYLLALKNIAKSIQDSTFKELQIINAACGVAVSSQEIMLADNASICETSIDMSIVKSESPRRLPLTTDEEKECERIRESVESVEMEYDSPTRLTLVKTKRVTDVFPSAVEIPTTPSHPTDTTETVYTLDTSLDHRLKSKNSSSPALLPIPTSEMRVTAALETSQTIKDVTDKRNSDGDGAEEEEDDKIEKKRKRHRRKRTRFSEKISATEDDITDATPVKKKAVKDFTTKSHARSKPRQRSIKMRFDDDSAENVDKENLKHSVHFVLGSPTIINTDKCQSKKRKRIKLIPDDSVFIPMQDQTLSLENQQQQPDKQVSPPPDALPKVNEAQQSPKVTEIRTIRSSSTDSFRSDSVSVDRQRRRTGPINYEEQSLGRKLRQGDAIYCKI